MQNKQVYCGYNLSLCCSLGEKTLLKPYNERAVLKTLVFKDLFGTYVDEIRFSPLSDANCIWKYGNISNIPNYMKQYLTRDEFKLHVPSVDGEM